MTLHTTAAYRLLTTLFTCHQNPKHKPGVLSQAIKPLWSDPTRPGSTACYSTPSCRVYDNAITTVSPACKPLHCFHSERTASEHATHPSHHKCAVKVWGAKPPLLVRHAGQPRFSLDLQPCTCLRHSFTSGHGRLRLTVGAPCRNDTRRGRLTHPNVTAQQPHGHHRAAESAPAPRGVTAESTASQQQARSEGLTHAMQGARAGVAPAVRIAQ